MSAMLIAAGAKVFEQETYPMVADLFEYVVVFEDLKFCGRYLKCSDECSDTTACVEVLRRY